MSDNNNNNDDYECYCYLCRRPESSAGTLIKLPNNINICNDCMQKSFDALGGNNLQFMDFSKMPNINMSEFMPFDDIPKSQKVKKKKKKEEAKEEPELSLATIPAPHKIKAMLDEYVVGQSTQRKLFPLPYIITISVL